MTDLNYHATYERALRHDTLVSLLRDYDDGLITPAELDSRTAGLTYRRAQALWDAGSVSHSDESAGELTALKARWHTAYRAAGGTGTPRYIPE